MENKSNINQNNTKKDLSINFINDKIDKSYSKEIENELKDENLLKIYTLTKSFKKEVDILTKIIKNNLNIEDNILNNIINDYQINLIPPGTKGVIKGNLFNTKIKELILNIDFLKLEEYKIEFEKQPENYKFTEIPDFYIYNIKNNKILIGMNQLSLWGGGQQYNRASKYILDENLYSKENIKILSVVCYKINIKNKKTKLYKIFNKGFLENSLCFPNELELIIKNYFNL